MQLRREKVELENALEQEQESLVNRLWKRMDKLEAEKRSVDIGWKCFFSFFFSIQTKIGVLKWWNAEVKYAKILWDFE